MEAFGFKHATRRPADKLERDESRTCISWTEEIDLPSDIVYDYGREPVPASR